MRVGVFTYDTMHNYRFFGNNRTVKRYEKRKVTGASLGIFANRKSLKFTELDLGSSFTTMHMLDTTTDNSHSRDRLD